MVWDKIQHYAYICRFGRQSFFELLGRRATALELALFSRALGELMQKEYGGGGKGLAPTDDDD